MSANLCLVCLFVSDMTLQPHNIPTLTSTRIPFLKPQQHSASFIVRVSWLAIYCVTFIALFLRQLIRSMSKPLVAWRWAVSRFTLLAAIFGLVS